MGALWIYTWWRNGFASFLLQPSFDTHTVLPFTELSIVTSRFQVVFAALPGQFRGEPTTGPQECLDTVQLDYVSLPAHPPARFDVAR